MNALKCKLLGATTIFALNIGALKAAEEKFIFNSTCEAGITEFETKKPGVIGVKAVYAKLAISPALDAVGVKNAGIFYRSLFFDGNEVVEKSHWIQRYARSLMWAAGRPTFEIYLRPANSTEFLEGIFFVELQNGNMYWVTPGAEDEFSYLSESKSLYYYKFSKYNINGLVQSEEQSVPIPTSFKNTECFYSNWSY